MESGIAEDEEAGQSGMDPSRPDTLSRTRRSIDLRALDERAEKDLHDHLQKVRVRFLAKDPNVTRGEGPGERKYGKHARSAPRSEPLIIQPRKGRPADPRFPLLPFSRRHLQAPSDIAGSGGAPRRAAAWETEARSVPATLARIVNTEGPRPQAADQGRRGRPGGRSRRCCPFANS